MGLRSTLDNLEPHFKPGGKYQAWYALYEAVDTIFYSPSSVTQSSAHVRDGIDLKRIMITVWFCTFPAMFYGMYNLGYQANEVIAAGGYALEGWRGGIVASLGGFDPNSLWDNFLYGAVHFLPLYAITFIVGGFWEVLFAMKRGHEINEGFFCDIGAIYADVAARPTTVAGGDGDIVRYCRGKRGVRRNG